MSPNEELVQDAGADDVAGAPDASYPDGATTDSEAYTVPEVTVTGDALAGKLQAVADYAYSVLQMPLADNRKLIFDAEHPADPTNWCGNTLAYFYKHEGADVRVVNAYFGGAAGLASYGSYYRVGYNMTTGELVTCENSAKDTKISVDGANVSLEEYHAQQGALRKIILFEEIQQGEPLDILPGDIVLFDGRNKSGPDHIQLVYQWYEDERLLIVIDGNGGGFELAESGANSVTPEGSANASHDNTLKTDKMALLTDKLGTDVIYTNDQAAGRVGVTCHLLTADNQVNPPPGNTALPHARVWAIIRPSAVDFEPHIYSNL